MDLEKENVTSMHLCSSMKTFDVLLHPDSLPHPVCSERCLSLYWRSDQTTCLATRLRVCLMVGKKRAETEMFAINALAPFCLAAGNKDQMRRL